MFNLDTDEWVKIYALPFTLLSDNKIIDLQYRILHRTLGTNKLLYQIRKRNTPSCDMCMMFPETIEHLMFECNVVKNFWFTLFNCYNQMKKVNISISCKDIVLYFTNTDYKDEETCVNILILYGKSYLYTCKMAKQEPNILGFTRQMTLNLKILNCIQCKCKEELAQIVQLIQML